MILIEHQTTRDMADSQPLPHFTSVTPFGASCAASPNKRLYGDGSAYTQPNAAAVQLRGNFSSGKHKPRNE
jgi:hypothetical protein